MIASSAGSAAYEGYKYEHNKKTASSTKSATTASSTQSTKSTAAAPKAISDSDIE
jgi:hypothetical protein